MHAQVSMRKKERESECDSTTLAIAEKATQRNGSNMHWRDYHSLDAIYAYMREIRAKHPSICRLYTIGQTAEGRDLKVLR